MFMNYYISYHIGRKELITWSLYCELANSDEPPAKAAENRYRLSTSLSAVKRGDGGKPEDSQVLS